MPVTQQTIARAAGVSTTTVSFVLSGRAQQMQVNAGTAQHVREVADRLGFRANYHARSLSMGLSHTLGLVVPGDGSTMMHRFWAQIIGGVGVRARHRGYDLLVIGDRPELSAMGSAVRFVEQRRIDGAIVLPGARDARRWPAGSVVVGVNHRIAGHPTVTLDAAAGVLTAQRHLKNLGHQRIVYLGRRVAGWVVAQERVAAFEAGIRGLSLAGNVHLVEFADQRDAGVDWYIARYREAMRAYRPPPNVTAFMCYNDNMGLAFCSVLAERGVKVPEDVSVVGFDDLTATCAIPPLTTISHMLPELGAAAVDCAIDRIELRGKPPTALPDIRIDPRLIVRQSTAGATPLARGDS